MKKWSDNPDAVILADAISHRQCLARLQHPPYGDLVLTDKAYEEMVEELVPDDECRVRALIDIFNATSVQRASEQIAFYLLGKDKPLYQVKL